MTAPAGPPEPGTLGTVGFYGGQDVTLACHRYPDRAPILVLGGPSVTLTITTRDRGCGESGLAFANELQAFTQTFLADCIRLATDQDGTQPAAA